MFSGEETSTDKNELQKRQIEIKMQIKILVDELEIIELKLNENFGCKKQCVWDSKNNCNSIIQGNNNNNSSQSSNNNNSNTQNSINNAYRDSKLEYEEKQNDSFNSANDLDSIKKANTIYYDRNLTKFDDLKLFFESTWDVQFLDAYKIPKSNEKRTEREIAAFKKMRCFVNGGYIDHYEDKIRTASLTQEEYNLPPDQLKPLIENLFIPMIIRSKVLELFDKCAIEAGKLKEFSDGISMLQFYSYNTQELKYVIYSLIDKKQYITWNFEKLKSLFELWQGCIIGSSQFEYFVQKTEFDEGKNDCFLNLLKIKELELTGQEREILISILKATHNFCNRRISGR